VLTRIIAGKKFDNVDIVKREAQYKSAKSQKCMLMSSSNIFFTSMCDADVLCDLLLLRTSSSFSLPLKPSRTSDGEAGRKMRTIKAKEMGRIPSIKKIHFQARHPCSPSKFLLIPYETMPLKAPARVDVEKKIALRLVSSWYSYQKERSLSVMG
jgi:hypothetical protein